MSTPSTHTVATPPKPAKKEDDADKLYEKSFLAAVERNQIQVSRFLLLTLFAVHFLYPQNGYTHKFLHLQAPILNTNDTNNDTAKFPTSDLYASSTNVTSDSQSISSSFTGYYDISIDDTYYVVFWLVSLLFIRSILMQWCFEPFAKHFCKIYSKKAKVRFAEQSWSFVYYSFSLSYGLILYVGSPYFLNLDNIYAGWPHYQMTAAFKMYYLISIAFWFQQIIVLNVEQHRKDHYQMFSHHIITCCLVVGSYYYYFGRIGHMILWIMDSVDIFLAAAKMLRYAGFTKACDVMFIVFLAAWIVTRHGFYNVLFWLTWSRSFDLMKDSLCVPGVEAKRCWTPPVINTFLGLLGGLQLLIIIWMFMIVKVAYKVVTGTGAEDVRSDEDDTDVEEEEVHVPKSHLYDPTSVNLSLEKDGSSEATIIDDKETSSDASLDDKYEDSTDESNEISTDR
ncbi:TLC domain-containing protein [Scheffersomyces xylosifermentans]|uniref:TLC domain-containing protein n=1 Tax=Scheffersomyces xylosifermentans TaxID=1304137 RepID=UPI00315D3EF7